MEWERSSSNTKDFLSLLRQVVNIFLGFQGIISREFITEDGIFIVNVCFGHQHNMKMVSEYLRMKKFLDISFIDLMSLEPIDSKRRPLRLNRALYDQSFWVEHYNADTEDLKNSILNKLAEINYKVTLHSKFLVFNAGLYQYLIRKLHVFIFREYDLYGFGNFEQRKRIKFVYFFLYSHSLEDPF